MIGAGDRASCHGMIERAEIHRNPRLMGRLWPSQRLVAISSRVIPLSGMIPPLEQP
jgi:hypothetical protein